MQICQNAYKQLIEALDYEIQWWGIESKAELYQMLIDELERRLTPVPADAGTRG